MQRFDQKRATNRGPVIPSPLVQGEEEAQAPVPRERSNGKPQGRPGTPYPPSPDGVDMGGGVYVISVAARILNMHPQTLRKYERLGLVTPTRSIGMLRLYSAEDVFRIRLIKYMVDNLGMNLAGVDFALSLVNRIMALRDRVQAMSQTESLSHTLERELEEMLKGLDGVFPDNLPRV